MYCYNLYLGIIGKDCTLNYHEWIHYFEYFQNIRTKYHQNQFHTVQCFMGFLKIVKNAADSEFLCALISRVLY